MPTSRRAAAVVLLVFVVVLFATVAQNDPSESEASRAEQLTLALRTKPNHSLRRKVTTLEPSNRLTAVANSGLDAMPLLQMTKAPTALFSTPPIIEPTRAPTNQPTSSPTADPTGVPSPATPQAAEAALGTRVYDGGGSAIVNALKTGTSWAGIPSASWVSSTEGDAWKFNETGCPPSMNLALRWPTMYHGCGCGSCVHWLDTPPSRDSEPPPVGSQTLLQMMKTNERCSQRPTLVSAETSSKSLVSCDLTCDQREAGFHTVAGVSGIYCDGSGAAVIQNYVKVCGREYGVLSRVDNESCGFLGEGVVRQLAAYATGVVLRDIGRGSASSADGMMQSAAALATGADSQPKQHSDAQRGLAWTGLDRQSQLAERKVAVVATLARSKSDLWLFGGGPVQILYARSLLHPSWFLSQFGVPAGYDVPLPPRTVKRRSCKDCPVTAVVEPPYEPYNDTRVSRISNRAVDGRKSDKFNRWDGYFEKTSNQPLWAVPFAEQSSESQRAGDGSKSGMFRSKITVDLILRVPDRAALAWLPDSCAKATEVPVGASVPTRQTKYESQCFVILSRSTVYADSIACQGKYTHIVELPPLSDTRSGAVMLPGFGERVIDAVAELGRNPPSLTGQQQGCAAYHHIQLDGTNNFGANRDALRRALIDSCDNTRADNPVALLQCPYDNDKLLNTDYYAGDEFTDSTRAPTPSSLNLLERFIARTASRADSLSLLREYAPSVPFGPNAAVYEGPQPSPPVSSMSTIWLEPSLYERPVTRSSPAAFVEFVMNFGPGVEWRDVPEVVGPRVQAGCAGGASSAGVAGSTEAALGGGRAGGDFPGVADPAGRETRA